MMRLLRFLGFGRRKRVDAVNLALSAPRNAGVAFDLSRQGRFEESNQVARAVLRDLDQLAGPTRDDMCAKLLGLVGTNLYHLGDLPGCREYTLKAAAICRQTGDRNGAQIYATTLRALAGQPMSAAPDLLRRETALVEAIAKAQRLSDVTRFAESNERLQALLDRPGDGGDALTNRYRGKVLGLLGLNHYRLGEVALARRLTAAALAACEADDDAEGVVIYKDNLRHMQNPSSAPERR